MEIIILYEAKCKDFFFEFHNCFFINHDLNHYFIFKKIISSKNYHINNNKSKKTKKNSIQQIKISK